MVCRLNDLQCCECILQVMLDIIVVYGIYVVMYCKIVICVNVLLGLLIYYFSGIEVLIEEVFSLFIVEMLVQYQ